MTSSLSKTSPRTVINHWSKNQRSITMMISLVDMKVILNSLFLNLSLRQRMGKLWRTTRGTQSGPLIRKIIWLCLNMTWHLIKCLKTLYKMIKQRNLVIQSLNLTQISSKERKSMIQRKVFNKNKVALTKRTLIKRGCSKSKKNPSTSLKHLMIKQWLKEREHLLTYLENLWYTLKSRQDTQIEQYFHLVYLRSFIENKRRSRSSSDLKLEEWLVEDITNRNNHCHQLDKMQLYLWNRKMINKLSMNLKN